MKSLRDSIKMKTKHNKIQRKPEQYDSFSGFKMQVGRYISAH